MAMAAITRTTNDMMTMFTTVINNNNCTRRNSLSVAAVAVRLFWSSSRSARQNIRSISQCMRQQQQPLISSSRTSQLITARTRRQHYFTNTDRMKRDDPYAVLGLDWADMPTSKDIRTAYRRLAAKYHPDVAATTTTSTKDNNDDDNVDEPKKQRRNAKSNAHLFLEITKAYETLLKYHDSNRNNNDDESRAAWQSSIYRKADRIALDRTDVAGLARKRPLPSPANNSNLQKGVLLGHPQHGTTTSKRGEYLAETNNNEGNNHNKTRVVSNSVGTGRSKWVTPKKFVPWNGGGWGAGLSSSSSSGKAGTTSTVDSISATKATAATISSSSGIDKTSD